MPILKDVLDVKELSSAICTRIGLRYIDELDCTLSKCSKLELKIADNSLLEFNTTLRSEVEANGIFSILNLSNIENKSNIDVDSIRQESIEFPNLYSKLTDDGLLELMHKENKKFFFGILNDEFIKSLSPQYED